MNLILSTSRDTDGLYLHNSNGVLSVYARVKKYAPGLGILIASQDVNLPLGGMYTIPLACNRATAKINSMQVQDYKCLNKCEIGDVIDKNGEFLVITEFSGMDVVCYHCTKNYFEILYLESFYSKHTDITMTLELI